MTDAPHLPDYEGACVSRIVPSLFGGDRAWLPEPVRAIDAPVVLLVLDGLGWMQLLRLKDRAPTLSAMTGGPVSTVVPSTTASALASIALGLPPGEHGIVGYRMNIHGEILNVLRWTTDKGDARRTLPPAQIQHRAAFMGRSPIVVTRAEFQSSGFTAAHLEGARHRGWRTVSTLVVEVTTAVLAGEQFVYAYYDGVDKTSHEFGLGIHFDAEVAFADRLVADLLTALPTGTRLLVTADHGQVHVGANIVTPAPEVAARTRRQSGEGRFRWLHARAGRVDDLLAAATDAHGSQAWVVTQEQVRDEGWFGPRLAASAAARLGDVALVARAPVSFDDPAENGPMALIGRHGSLTREEMLVPLLAARA